MKKLFMILPMVLLLCFTFGYQQGEEPVEEAVAKVAGLSLKIDNLILTSHII